MGKESTEIRMDAHEYMTLLEQLERELTAWPSADCTALLGVLERVRVSAWAQVLESSSSSPQALSRQDGGRLLTLPQVAERLTIPEGYAYEMARRGMLPVVRLGKYVRVPLAEFETWVGQQTSLERRIDRAPHDFHSALGVKKKPGKPTRPMRILTGAQAQSGGAGRAKPSRASSTSPPNIPVDVRPQPTTWCPTVEPHSAAAEESHEEE